MANPSKAGWFYFATFFGMIMLCVFILARASCDDLEKELTRAMLSTQDQTAGIFKITKHKDGGSLISLE